RQALSNAAADNRIIVIESITSNGKTAELAKLLDKIGATKNVLIVVDNKSTDLTLASRNLANTKVVAANYINVFDALNADSIVFTNAALAVVTDWLGGVK
ncbi:MAG TPA: 50S ribosomal protein L4, partial [Candidatus Saccharimonadales bacterium]|nr:50S ribosomal protein L4 [Candidatus Saccharimonadales bacterium]